jgi:hypothetical protein
MEKNVIKIQKRLAKNIIALRIKRDWSQEEAADNLQFFQEWKEL